MAQTSIDDILALYDRPFLTAAYTTLVGRDVDPEAERFYLARLRSGISRQQILWELMQSQEAQALGARPAGLQELLADLDRARSRSPVKRLLSGDPEASRQLIRTENMVGTMSHQVDRLMLMVNHCVFRADELRRDFDSLRQDALVRSEGGGEGAARLAPASSVPAAALPGPGAGVFRRLRRGALGHRRSVG